MSEIGLNCGINKTSIMATKIMVPDIGDFENVEIIEILTKSGAIIKKNDPVVTLESDKSSVEVPSPFSGKISSLDVKIGDKVSKGSILATIEDDKAEIFKDIQKSEKLTQTEQKKEKPLILKEEEVLPETEKIIKEAESTISQKIKKRPAKKIPARSNGADIDPIETREWLDSLTAVISQDGSDRAHYILKKLIDETYKEGINKPLTRNTPYMNTITPENEVKSPGDQNIERKIRSLIRWKSFFFKSKTR